jgi:hypothetical protein
MNTQQNTEHEIKFWTMMKIKHNDTYNEWCPQSFKDELEEEENDCCEMCLHPKCECENIISVIIATAPLLVSLM